MTDVFCVCFFFFFFNDTATTEIYTLSLHDALPICCHGPERRPPVVPTPVRPACPMGGADRPPYPRTWQDQLATRGANDVGGAGDGGGDGRPLAAAGGAGAHRAAHLDGGRLPGGQHGRGDLL